MQNKQIIRKPLGYDALCAILDRTLQQRSHITLGIDGYAGAGKSTVAALVSERYGCPVVHIDDFFPPVELRQPGRLLRHSGFLHHERLLSEVIVQLWQGVPVTYRRYNWYESQYTDEITIAPSNLSNLIIIEGSYSLHPLLSWAYDVKAYVITDHAAQCARIRERNGDALLRRFMDEWFENEYAYERHFGVISNADCVLFT